MRTHGKSDGCKRITYEIWQWAIDRNIWMSAARTPGVDNYEADNYQENLILILNGASRMKYSVKWFPFLPTIDLFASRVNSKLPTYVSWKPDPFARYVDEFTVNWALYPFYAFHPFIPVGRCLEKVRGDGATGLLIVPMWPTQSYFDSLLKMLVDLPLYFKETRTTLTNPSVEELTYPLRVTLLVCRVSKIPFRVRDFRQKLPTSFCPCGKRVHLNNTMCTSRKMVHVSLSRQSQILVCPCFVNFGFSSWFIYQGLRLFVPEHC